MTDIHLDPEVIARVATRRANPAERAEALAHADRCEACRADLVYLIGFERRRRRRQVAVAAGVVLSAAAVVTLVPPATSPGVSVAETRSGDEGIPLVASYLPGNGSRVFGDSIRFAWQSMGVDTHYRFQLSTASGAPVLDRAVRDTTTYVARLPYLEVGETYLWFVDALTSDGGAARSKVWSFTVRE